MLENYEAPIKAGEKHSVKIVDTGSEGDGICKFGALSYVCFVSGAKIGEKVLIEIDKVLPRFAFAHIIAEEDSESGDAED